MTIKTKLNIGDKAYFLHKNKIVVKEIYKIYIDIEINHNGFLTTSINYYFKINHDTFIENERNCFATKEELLESI